jgi:hypothetical protein
MIPITTPKAPLKCGQKTVGIILPLKYCYGGPGLTHDYTNVLMVIFPTKVSNTSIMIN